jgi:hypothetical protein
VWAQPLFINGTVNTGYISASFDEYNEVPTDPYAEVIAVREMSNPVNHDPAENDLYDILHITINDAYPSFDGTVKFWVENTGTVPFYVTPGDLVVKDPWGNVVTDVITVTMGADSGIIVEPNTHNGPFTIEITVPGEGVEEFVDPIQHETYTLTVPLTATQYLVPVPEG